MLLLIDGEHLEAESFRQVSLANAKQLVWGPVSLFGGPPRGGADPGGPRQRRRAALRG